MGECSAMKYKKVIPGTFIVRHNRFVAEVDVEDRRETVHVKNTGRCRELLVPGYTVCLAETDNPARRTRYDLIAVRKERPGKMPLLINMDSQIPNGAAVEWLQRSGMFSSAAVFRREVTYQQSRFDIFVTDGDRKAFIEVKGVTLEHDGVALFPDAPTERGVKHLKELAGCAAAGFESYVFFVIQMKEITRFSPHDAMHPAFGEALRQAVRAGVKILAMDCRVTPDSIQVDAPVAVVL